MLGEVHYKKLKFQKDDKSMLPPMSSKVRRRGNTGRRGVGAAHSRSTPSTPDQVKIIIKSM